MSALWDDIKKNLKVLGSAAAEKAEEIGKVAATKTEELTKISKVKLEIHQLQRDLDKSYARLGKYVFEAASGENVTNFANNEQFSSHIKEAQDLIDQVRVKEERLEEIRAEYESSEKSEPETGQKETPETSEESKS